MASRKYPFNYQDPFLSGAWPVEAPPGVGSFQNTPSVSQIQGAFISPAAAAQSQSRSAGLDPLASYGPTNQYPGMRPGGTPDVWMLQNNLNQKGAGLATDGLMGPKTRAAMARYGVSASPVAPSGGGPSPQGGQMGAMTAGSQAPGGPSGDFLSQLMAALGPAPQAPAFDPKQIALDTIAQQYGAQEGAINRAMQSADVLYKSQNEAQQQYGQVADQKLEAVYNALQNDLMHSQDLTSQNYSRASQNVGGSYDQATQGLSDLNNQVGSQFLENANKLGITQGAASPLGKLQQTYALMQGGNLQNKANSLAGLSQDQANFLGLGQSDINSSRKQGAQARADVATQVRNTLAQLGLSNAQTQTGYQGQLADLEKGKAADYRNLLSQLGQSQYEQQRQSRLDQLAEMVQLGTLDTQRQYMGIRQQTADQNYQLGLGNLALQQAKLQADLAQTQDPLKRQQLQAQIDSLNANAMQSLAQADYYSTGGSKKQQDFHQDILDQFLGSEQNGLWGPGGAGPNFRGALLNTEGDPMGLIPSAQSQGKLSGVDPYTYASANAQRYAAQSGLDLNGILTALRLYFRGQ